MKASSPSRAHILIWGRWLVLVGITLYGLAMIVGLLMAQVSLNQAYWELGRTALWLMMLPLPLAFVLAALLRSRWVLLFLLPPLIAWGIHYIPQFMPKSPGAPPDSQTFTLLTYNVLTEGDGKEAILQAILDADADVVALQELSLTVADYLQENLAEQYPYTALHGQQWNVYRGQGIFSRFPILEDEYWIFQDFARKSHGQQRVRIEIAGQPLVIYNAHPWPPFEWRGGIDFHFSPIPDAAHSEAVERLLARIDRETDPLLLVGDLNTSPYYEEYQWMTERLTDSYREAGVGLGLTYPACGIGFLPTALIRIDHVMHSAGLTALDAGIFNGCPVSDHHAVWVQLALHP